jgi:hypothetical protein
LPASRSRLTSCGKSALHVDLSIRDADGRPLPVGEVGELPKGGTHKIAKHQLREGFHNDPQTVPRGGQLNARP